MVVSDGLAAPDRRSNGERSGNRQMHGSDARLLTGAALLALVAGVLVLALASGLVATVAAIALLGLAGIALVALVFLLVGESEDRDRRHNPRG
jgi:hypothetical protein